MGIDRRHLVAGLGAIVASTGLPRLGNAQVGNVQAAAPFKGTGRIFAGFPAGGTLDQTARRFAESIRANYPDGLIVENRVGAGGRLAVDAVKAAAPDGVGLLVTPDSMFTIYPSYYKKLSYDPVADIAPVSAMVTFPFGFAVSAKVPAGVKTLSEFVDWAKKNPGDASYGHPSTGSSPHFCANEFNRVSGAGMRHVPYRGSAPALQDLVGGHIAAVMTVLGDFLPFLADGKIRMLAVSSEKRSKFVPGVATFTEQGFKEATGQETYGIFLPGKADMALRQRFAGYVKAAAGDPAVVKALEAIGMELTPMMPAEYADYLARQRSRWAPIVKASGFSADE